MSSYLLSLSSSKHDGLAGSRFGWGLIKDVDLATRMSAALEKLVLSLSVDNQLRVLTNLEFVLSEYIGQPTIMVMEH